jgi:4a-hydroxytetrahydrobiopterin dehydratase
MLQEQRGYKMASLTGFKCEACARGAPRLSQQEFAEFHEQIPYWYVIEQDGVKRLERAFRFPDFTEALEFTNRVGEIAEQEGHHPAILTEWGLVTVQWWTHKIDGLHRNDLVMAAKTDKAYGY